MKKKRWTALLPEHPPEAYASEKDMKKDHHYNFMREHSDACEIIINRFGDCIAAVYFTSDGIDGMERKRIMGTIRDRVPDL